jgi:zinc protease
MVSRHLLLGVSALVMAACAGPGGQEMEARTEAESAAAFDLPYQKFTLDNGLEVVLHQDTSDPIVAFSTVVHVGSNREKPGRTGFAHFFEHMAFNDSENVPRGWNRLKIPEWGGQRNGGTWSDGTIYYEVVPKDTVDKILWIDSDRLGYMIKTVTEEALEREKQVVKNEKRQRVDNVAYGFEGEITRAALYPEGHPYSWSVIGQLEDLQNATLEDLTEFYERYYGASNATLAIAGDFDPAEMREKVETWFGEIRRGPGINALQPMPVTLEADKSLYWEDNFATLPQLAMTMPTVEAGHPDELALRVLGAVLGGSKSAPLYEVIVEEEKLAPGVTTYNSSSEIAGEFVIKVRANQGTDLDEVKAAIERGLARFAEEGVDPVDLKRIKAEQETALYASVSTVLGKANQLASDNEFFGDPAYAVKQAEALQALSADDVMRVFREHVEGQPAVITSFVPKGEVGLALEGSSPAEVAVEVVRNDVEAEEVSAGAVAEYEKTPSRIDRSEPDFGELPLFEMPDIYEAELAGGAELLGIESFETPVVTFDVVIDGGRIADPMGASGRANLFAGLLEEGTAARNAAAFEQAAGLLGATISVSAAAEDLVISVTTLARNFEETVALVEEMVRTPRFEEAAFDKVQRQLLTSIRGNEANPRAVAFDTYKGLLYGAHPAGRPSLGIAGEVETLSLADMRRLHEELLQSKVSMHLVGAVEEPRAEEGLAPIAASFSGESAEEVIPEVPATDLASRVYFIDVPGSKQSVIYAGKLSVPTTDDAYRLIDFTNEKLGGGISGDLAQTLRIEKGYTYGAQSWIGEGSYPQPWTVGTSVRSNATGPSLDIISDMVASYAETFDEEDAEITKQKVVKANTRAYESLFAKLGMLQSISRYDLSTSYLEEAQDTLLAMDVGDFREVAERYLTEDDMVYVVVGDGATQREAVRAFAGGEMTELGTDGQPL